MASSSSSSDDQQPKTRDRSSSPPPPPSGNNPPPIYPPPNVGYNQGHTYPPAMGYPPPPPPHPGYPPAPGHHYPPNYNPYPYAQAPPASYYNNAPQHYPPDTVSAGFIRGVMAALILLVVLMTLSSVITWIILRPEIPTFKIDSFAVANFNISKSNYSGNWDAALTVHNPNLKLNLNFERIQSFVDFKDNTLATSYADPFFLDVEKTTQMRVKWTSSSPDDPGNWAETEDKMGRERAAGPVGFNLRFFIWTTFRSGSWWKKRVVMRVFCEDVKLVFAGVKSGNGAFSAHGNPKDCAVLV